jgi:hypothetical protein
MGRSHHPGIPAAAEGERERLSLRTTGERIGYDPFSRGPFSPGLVTSHVAKVRHASIVPETPDSLK